MTRRPPSISIRTGMATDMDAETARPAGLVDALHPASDPQHDPAVRIFLNQPAASRLSAHGC